MIQMENIRRSLKINMDKQNKTNRIDDLMAVINIILCSFLGIGFIYSPSKLFQYLGGLFLLWICVYTCYCFNRGDKK